MTKDSPKIYHVVLRVTADDKLDTLWDSSPMVTLDDYKQAADEIERLKARLSEAQKLLSAASPNPRLMAAGANQEWLNNWTNWLADMCPMYSAAEPSVPK
jgi:hypothetical protein